MRGSVVVRTGANKENRTLVRERGPPCFDSAGADSGKGE